MTPPPIIIDTHAHLDQEEFDDDRFAVIERSRQAGVHSIVAIGTTAESSEKVVDLAAQHDGLFAAVGIQPNYCAEASLGDWERIVELAKSPRVVAIGETGLDRYWDYSPLELQRDFFDRHIRLAQRLDLPFVVHTRDSDEDVLKILRSARSEGSIRGIMHSFTGSQETAAECVDLGMYISFAGMVTFKKSEELRQVAAAVPSGRLLIETDSPYLSPHPLRGKRNEPAHLIHTATCLAEVRKMAVRDFAELTSDNARRLLGIA